MNQILKYGSVNAIPLYNCSAHSPEEWSLKNGVRRPITGFFEFFYGILIIMLYTPMFLVMIEKDNFKLSCFKIMALLTIIDIFSITVNSLITGFLSFKGAVFCTYPTFIYISGLFGMSLWCCACTIALTLVVNRLFEMISPRWGRFFFNGNRTFFILSFSIFYGFFFFFCTTPILYTSKYVTWFLDPLIFNGKGMEYANIPHFYNNVFIVASTGCLYGVFCYALGNKTKNVRGKSNTLSRQIFFQSTMICAINQAAAIIYLIMNYIDIPFWLIILGQIMWQLGHGSPAIIYFLFNKTLRNGVLRKFGFKKTIVSSTKGTGNTNYNDGSQLPSTF